VVLEVAVASGKGGVGKSTISATLALHLHRAGWDVVAADADADAPNLHIVFGLDEWGEVREYSEGYVARIDYGKCTNCGVCADVCPFKAVSFKGGRYVINSLICEGCVTCSLACPERAISRVRHPTGVLRTGVTRYGFPLVSARLNVGRPNSGRLVTEVKNMAREVAKSSSVIVVDSAAGIGCQVVSSLAGANAVVLVAEPTPASFSDLRRVHKLAKHFMLPSALVLNKVDINPGLSRSIREYALREGIDILGEVPYDDAVPKSMSLRMPVVEAFPNSRASKALIRIAEEFERRVVRGWRDWFRRFKPRKPEPYRPIIIKPPTLR